MKLYNNLGGHLSSTIVCTAAITTTTPVTTTPDPGTPVETAAIIGGVLGSLALIALVVLLVIACKSWKLGKVCLSRKEETEKPGSKAKSLAKGCFCWNEGTRKEDKAKLKKGKVIAICIRILYVRGLSQKYVDICDKTVMGLQNFMKFIQSVCIHLINVSYKYG